MVSDLFAKIVANDIAVSTKFKESKLRNKVFDYLMKCVQNFSTELVLLPFIIVCYSVYFFNIEWLKRTAFAVLAIIIIKEILESFIKSDEQENQNKELFAFSYPVDSFDEVNTLYPCFNTALVCALSIISGVYLPSKSIVLIIYPFIVAISSLYLGKKYLSGTIIGLLIGVIMSLFGLAL